MTKSCSWGRTEEKILKSLSGSANELGSQDTGRIIFVGIGILKNCNWNGGVEAESETGTKFL